MVDYLNLTAGEQKVHGDVHAWHEEQCGDCEPRIFAEDHRWENLPINLVNS